MSDFPLLKNPAIDNPVLIPDVLLGLKFIKVLMVLCIHSYRQPGGYSIIINYLRTKPCFYPSAQNKKFACT